MSWWNPFSWGAGGEVPDPQEGIWGGAPAGGQVGFPLGAVLGEARGVGALPDAGAVGSDAPAEVPSELARAFGGIGGGFLGGDVLGDLRALGSGLGEPSPRLEEVLAGTGEVPAPPDAGAGLGEEGPSAEVDVDRGWLAEVVGAADRGGER